MGLLYLAETAALTVATLIIGTFGTLALAANQVATAVGGLLYMLPMGIAGAVAILVAQGTGAGGAHRVRPVVLAGLAVATLWLVMAAAALLILGEEIAGAIVQDPQVIPMAAAILAVFALMQVFDGVQSTMVGALRGLSDAGYSAAVSMVAFWLAGLPLAWIFAHPLGLGPPGVWLGWLVALMGAAAVLARRFAILTR